MATFELSCYLVTMGASADGRELEESLGNLLGTGYRQAPARERAFDFERVDGREAIEIKRELLGVRDLRAALVQLACALAEHPQLNKAVLVSRTPSLSSARVRAEWRRIQEVLQPTISSRLALVVLAGDEGITLPANDPSLESLLGLAREAFGERGTSRREKRQAPTWPVTQYEVWKVLLDRWLRCEPPLAVQELARRSGCSYPSVAATLARLESIGEVERTSSRAAGLRSMPHRSLGEVAVLGDYLRRMLRFVDTSGRPPDPEDLLRRMKARTTSGVRIGGVAAARHYMPTFNLNGYPRLDLTFHQLDPATWSMVVEKLDPALAQTSATTRSPVLVAHLLRRTHVEKEEVYADPAETLLDLYELRLIEQAEDFAQALRAKGGAK